MQSSLDYTLCIKKRGAWGRAQRESACFTVVLVVEKPNAYHILLHNTRYTISSTQNRRNAILVCIMIRYGYLLIVSMIWFRGWQFYFALR